MSGVAPQRNRLERQQKRVQEYATLKDAEKAASLVTQARVEYARVCCVCCVMAGFCVVAMGAAFRLSLVMCRCVMGVRVAPAIQ